MTLRRPRTAAQSTALPSLAALLASGVAIDGCDSPADSAERLSRLTAHGEQAGRELDAHQHGRAATEVGIGLGLLQAPPETRISAPGEGPAVQIETPIQTAGMQAPTQLTPPLPVPVPRPVDVDGGVREVSPTPPRPPVHHPPTHAPIRGGAPAVRPHGGNLPDL